MNGKVELQIEEIPDKGKIARLTLDYRERINIVNTPLLLQLRSAIESLHHDDQVRVLVLTGAGDKAFIGGADIREMVDLEPDSAHKTGQAFVAPADATGRVATVRTSHA